MSEPSVSVLLHESDIKRVEFKDGSSIDRLPGTTTPLWVVTIAPGRQLTDAAGRVRSFDTCQAAATARQAWHGNQPPGHEAAAVNQELLARVERAAARFEAFAKSARDFGWFNLAGEFDGYAAECRRAAEKAGRPPTSPSSTSAQSGL